MKKFLVFVLALAGVLGFSVPVSAQHVVGTTGPINLELDGSIGDGGTYAVFVGIRPVSDSRRPIFPSGFTVRYRVWSNRYDNELVGEMHYGGTAEYLDSRGSVSNHYYYPTDSGGPFYRLNENPPGSRPVFLNQLYLEIIPDNMYYFPVFNRIVIEAKPFIEKMIDSGLVLGEETIGMSPAEHWNVQCKVLEIW